MRLNHWVKVVLNIKVDWTTKYLAVITNLRPITDNIRELHKWKPASFGLSSDDVNESFFGIIIVSFDNFSKDMNRQLEELA